MLKEEYGCGNQQATECSKLVLSHIVCQEASNGLEEKNLGRRCSVLWKQLLDIISCIFKIPEFSEFPTNSLPSCEHLFFDKVTMGTILAFFILHNSQKHHKGFTGRLLFI